MSDHAFCRAHLADVMKDVREVTDPTERASCWTWKSATGVWEFHGPRGFYWHGSAHCGWHCRARAWEAWLVKFESS